MRYLILALFAVVMLCQLSYRPSRSWGGTVGNYSTSTRPNWKARVLVTDPTQPTALKAREMPLQAARGVYSDCTSATSIQYNLWISKTRPPNPSRCTVFVSLSGL